MEAYTYGKEGSCSLCSKALCVGDGASLLECSLREFAGGYSYDIRALPLVLKYYCLDAVDGVVNTT